MMPALRRKWTAVFWTLGCKLNQAETESIAAAFAAAGWKIHDEVDGEPAFADLAIVNTCTVTSKAEQKARRLIRSLLQRETVSKIIVTGCYAQLERSALLKLAAQKEHENRLYIVSDAEKASLLKLPAALEQAGGLAEFDAAFRLAIETGTDKTRFDFSPEIRNFHTRAFLKIQDGCDNNCAFCRVHLARGPAVSLDAQTVLERTAALEAAGAAEVVLTGVNINQYRSGSLELGALLTLLLENTSRIAFRLSSLETSIFTPVFFDAVRHERIRPHFHLSVQSGSAAVLQRMGRQAAPDAMLEHIAMLRKIKNDPFIACDIITGFPGESAVNAAETLLFCQKAEFAWIHAFPFSPRPGTAAAAFNGKVSQRESGERLRALVKLAMQGKNNYIQRWLGKETQAVVEQKHSTVWTSATSANYLKIALNTRRQEAAGTEVRCKITATCKDNRVKADVLGEVC